eukprot:TRINITY_DN67974_c6_g8_i1.p1 TRINITY_DN67974_c6_g8~~TRINITY_DN67974_c6_g8_i1.p1  ORF type:complete len:614 (+),score=68.08 TRINITY_DN67974_c6_g8_i1:58-1899(+)
MSNSASVNRSLDYFNRGDYEGAFEAGSHAMSDPEAEPVILHGLVGTSQLYLRERTESPLPELPKRQSVTSASPRWTPTAALSRSDEQDGVSKRPPALRAQSIKSEAEIEHARRVREQERARAQEERLRREQEDRDRRRREREEREAAERAAEEARLNRDAEVRARMRREAEDAERRRQLKELEDALQKAIHERDAALAELRAAQATILHDREQADKMVHSQIQRIEDLEKQLRELNDELTAERTSNRADPQQLEQMQRELQLATTALENAKADADADRKLVEHERDAANAKLKPLQAQVDALQVETQRLTNAATLSQAEHERQMAEINKRHGDEKAQLERDFGVLKELTIERDNLAQDLQREKNERDRSQQEANKISRERDELQRALQRSETAHQALAEDLTIAQGKLDGFSDEARVSREAERRVREDLQRAQNDLTRRARDCQDQLSSQSDQHARTLRAMDEDLTRAQNEHFEQMQAMNHDLNNQLQKVSELQKELAEAKSHAKEQDAKVENLTMTVSRMQQLEDKLADQANNHQREKESLHAQLVETDAKYNELLALLEGWKAERMQFDSRTDMLISKAKRAPSPPRSMPYSPEKYAAPSPAKSDAGAAAQ